ncbi:MAG: PadR family transcriptional regulator [Acidimicrobiia bacterium]
MVRRKPGALLPLELSILTAGVEAMQAGEPEFHGFSIANAIQDRDAARRLTAHGTLYKALARLERAGLLESRWEEPELAEADGRPRRRLYRVTGAGAAAVTRARAEGKQRRPSFRPGPAMP